MKTYTEAQVRKKLKDFVSSHPTIADAAKAAKVTPSEMSIAVNGGRIPGKVIAKLGLAKQEVYTDG